MELALLEQVFEKACCKRGMNSVLTVARYEGAGGKGLLTYTPQGAGIV